MHHLRFENKSKAGAAKSSHYITRVDDAGNVVKGPYKTTGSPTSLILLCGSLDVMKARLLDTFAEYERGGFAEYEAPVIAPLSPPEEKPTPVFLLRSIKQPAVEGKTFANIFDAIAAPCDAEDPVIEWEDTEVVCCLDLDFHNGGKPDGTDLLQAAYTIRPVPDAWWVSKSGGLHLLYSEHGVLSATDRAAIAGAKLASRFGSATVELKNRTRRPGGEVFRNTVDGRGAAGGLLAHDAAAADFSEWLEERGFVIGQRYEHELCPVKPSPRTSGNVPPVVVYEDHIYCHSCNAAGVRRGCKTPGYFPLAVLAGAVQDSMFRRCVENFTHWGHAKYIIANIVPQENLAKPYYRAALRQRHGDDPRIPLVFAASPKTGLVRLDGYWSGDSGRAKVYGKDSAVLAQLPVCKRLDPSDLDDNGKPKLRSDTSIVEELASSDDLSPYGYPALIRVWGLQLTQMQDQPANRIFSVLQRNGTPEYLPTARRLEEEQAWNIIEGLYPGLNRKAVELLIAAKGCTEYRAGLPPMVFLTGPTGAGKTQSINLAASICGDQATVVTFSKEEERLRQGIMVAKEAGSFAFFDEYLKSARRRGIEADQAMEFVLNLAPDSVSHKLYVGPVPLGDLPVCCWADTAIPAEVLAHSQIARRVHHVSLRDSKQWNRATKDLRSEGDEVCKAADSILSHIMDRWFLPPGPTDFADVAAALGYYLFNSDEAAEYKQRLIRQFFELVSALPDADSKLTKGRDGTGWKVIDPHGSGELMDCWVALADADKPTSRVLSEVDLRKVIGAAEYTEFQSYGIKGGRVLVRFVNEGRTKVNGGLRGQDG